MPKRTNDFQELVAIVRRHLAPDADIEESAMIAPLRGGPVREVDVCIRSSAAGESVTFAVEATQRSRPANIQYIDQMIGKYCDLPIHKIILYCRAGYTAEAVARAKAFKISLVSSVDLQAEDRDAAVLQKLRSLWPKIFFIQPLGFKLKVRSPAGEEHLFTPPNSILVFDEAGDPIDARHSLAEVTNDTFAESMSTIAQALGIQTMDQSSTSLAEIIVEPASVTREDGTEVDPYVRRGLADGTKELWQVTSVSILTKLEVQIPDPTEIRHIRLGEVEVAYGDFTIEGRSGLIVATGNETEGMMTIRLRG